MIKKSEQKGHHWHKWRALSSIAQPCHRGATVLQYSSYLRTIWLLMCCIITKSKSARKLSAHKWCSQLTSHDAASPSCAYFNAKCFLLDLVCTSTLLVFSHSPNISTYICITAACMQSALFSKALIHSLSTVQYCSNFEWMLHQILCKVEYSWNHLLSCGYYMQREQVPVNSKQQTLFVHLISSLVPHYPVQKYCKQFN